MKFLFSCPLHSITAEATNSELQTGSGATQFHIQGYRDSFPERKAAGT